MRIPLSIIVVIGIYFKQIGVCVLEKVVKRTSAAFERIFGVYFNYCEKFPSQIHILIAPL